MYYPSHPRGKTILRALPGRRSLLIIERHNYRDRADVSAGLRILAEHGFEVSVKVLDAPARIERIIREHAPRVDFVILGGGDLINTALEPLVAVRRPLAVLPVGAAASGLARSLKIPMSVAGACEAICYGRVHAIDLGRVNGRYFVNDAVLDACAPRSPCGGVRGRARTLLRALVADASFGATITCNGIRRQRRVVQIAVANSRCQEDGGLALDRVILDDGVLNLFSTGPASIWKVLRTVTRVRMDRYGGACLREMLHGRRIIIETERPIPILTDGELSGCTPAFFDVVPNALRVIVPEEYLEERYTYR